MSQQFPTPGERAVDELVDHFRDWLVEKSIRQARKDDARPGMYQPRHVEEAGRAIFNRRELPPEINDFIAIG